MRDLQRGSRSTTLPPNDLPLLLLLQALNEQLTLPLVVVAALAGFLALVAFLRGGDHRRSATVVAFDGDPLAAQLLANKEKLSLELVRSYDEASVYR